MWFVFAFAILSSASAEKCPSPNNAGEEAVVAPPFLQVGSQDQKEFQISPEFTAYLQKGQKGTQSPSQMQAMIMSMIPMITQASASYLFRNDPQERREHSSEVTPGNFDSKHLDTTFKYYCHPPGDEVNQDVWKKTVLDNAAANRDLGFDRVSFCARKMSSDESCVNISAWYLPAREMNRPTIIFIHGLHMSSVHEDPIVAASWARNELDYNVLMPDLRNHGHSQHTTGHRSWSRPEANDILGAIDCLESGCHPKLRQTSRSSIGLHGVSAGATTGYQVLALDEQIKGFWSDSGVFNLIAHAEHGIDMVMRANGVVIPPPFLSIVAGMVVPGLEQIGAAIGFSPDDYVHRLLPTAQANGRKVFLAHGQMDQEVPVRQTHLANEFLSDLGYGVDTWTTSASGDVTQCRGIHADSDDVHVDSKYHDPSGYISRMQLFWSDVFA